LGNGRSPQRYCGYCKEFFSQCRESDQPFYFMVNSHDPHRPYHVPGRKYGESEEPSRTYDPSEVEVPGFVPDLPGVREELSYYQNSTRRCDDTFGRVMQALDESGFRDNTLVVFLSDNGIAIPFAKCNVYLASTRTPWIVRWPGVVKPGTADQKHFISGVDFFPTVLEALGLPVPDGLDGTSFLPLLKGGSQEGRDMVFTQIDMKAGGDAVPMRCVQDEHYGYIYNAWSDGQHRYRNNNEGMTMKAMNEAAETDTAIAARVKVFRYRASEELYDLEKDPDCLRNLVDNPQHKEVHEQYRQRLRAWMVRTGDPLLAAFDHRDNRQVVNATIREYTHGSRKVRKKQ
jgi:N-sulfoglucosamine sulfohydrolase